MEQGGPSARFAGRQISNAQFSTRLVVLLPGSSDEALKLALSDVYLHETSYDCISYDRSQSHDTVDVDVDGESIVIPRPLESALRTLRYKESSRNVWADVLLGNTAEERSFQAASMRKVLENAEKVVAWLGPGFDHASQAFDIIQTIANQWHQACTSVGIGENLARATQKQLMGTRESIASYAKREMQRIDPAVWKAVEDILSSSYFKSIQTIPDIVLAKHAVITVGEHSISWQDVVAASRAAFTVIPVASKRYPSEEMIEVSQLIHALEVAERRQRTKEGLELLPMVQSARNCSASDSREYVFSMLPITRPSQRIQYTPAGHEEPPLVPDYSKSVQDVFKEAARYIVHERQDLLLWWTETPPCAKCTPGLPSWVPDWSSSLPSKLPTLSPENEFRRWSDSVPSPKRINVDDHFALSVQAHALDRVHTVSPIFTRENCRRLCLNEWQKLPDISDESEDVQYERFWRTIVLDSTATGETLRQPGRPPSEISTSFQSMLAEESLLELYNCTPEELVSNKEFHEEVRANPDMQVLAQLIGNGAEFEELLRNNALGRRFFQTKSGLIGMTSVESKPAGVNPEDGPPQPNFDEALSDPLVKQMLAGFQEDLKHKDPKLAEKLSKAMQGKPPGQSAPGVRAGDLIVALVAGFQPYILRPIDSNTASDSATAQLEAASTYNYFGDCYMHGVMDGECFRTTDSSGQETWKTDVKLVDITIT